MIFGSMTNATLMQDIAISLRAITPPIESLTTRKVTHNFQGLQMIMIVASKITKFFNSNLTIDEFGMIVFRY